MAITIPRAATIAGQSASLAPAAGQAAGAAAETSGLMAEFGQRMLAHGLAWKEKQRQREIQKAQIGILRDMGAARLEVEQQSDPALIGPMWDEKTAGIKDHYVSAASDPEVAAALGLSIDEFSAKHGLDLSQKVINLGRAQDEADWIEAREALTVDATSADPTTFGEIVAHGERMIDGQVASGHLDAAEGARRKKEWRTEVYGSRAVAAMNADPAAFLAAAEAGEYDALGGDRLVTYKVAAENEINRRAAAAAKAAEADAKVRSDAIGTRLDAIADLASKGRLVVDEADLSNPEVMAHPKWAKAMAAVSLRKEIPDLEVKTVPELDALIAAERGRQVVEPWENERLTALIALRDARVTGYAADPKKTARDSGIVPADAPDMPDFDPSDPAAWAEGLAASISLSGYLQEKGYTRRSAIFTTDQKTALKPVLDPKAEAGPKVALMEAILQGAGGNAAPVLAELEADPVFRRGLKVLALTGDRGLTEAILRGQQKAEANTVILPSRKEQIATFDALTGGVFDDAPALKEEIMAATLALYADGAAGIDGETLSEEGWIADGTAYNLYGTAFQKLTGAQPDRNGALTVGGLQELNGSLVVLPRGISVAEAETGWDTLTNRLLGGVISENWNESAADYSAHWDFAGADSIPMEARLAPFKAASLYGGLPDLGSDPGNRMAELSLRRVGESDVYELVWNDNGRLTTVPQAGTNHAYRFRLSDLLREAGK